MNRNYEPYKQVMESLLAEKPQLANNKTEFARQVIELANEQVRSVDAIRKLVRSFLESSPENTSSVNEIPDEPVLEPIKSTYRKDIPAQREKLHVVMGCMHMPFHNRRMFDSILKFLYENRDYIGSLTLNGDILDMHSISRHNKGKITIPGLTLESEYQQTNRELDKIDEALGNKNIRKHYLYGNHEMWYYSYMQEVDHSKLGQGVILSPNKACLFEERGYEVQTDYKNAYVMLGDIEVIHGDYVNVNASKRHLDVMKRNVIFVHTHRIGSHAEESIAAYNIGWCGQKDERVFGYMTRIQKENWRNGFNVVMVDSDNISHANQIEYINNKFSFDGRFY
jgi:hypothetical protein